jgi:pyruvate,water dikinase
MSLLRSYLRRNKTQRKTKAGNPPLSGEEPEFSCIHPSGLPFSTSREILIPRKFWHFLLLARLYDLLGLYSGLTRKALYMSRLLEKFLIGAVFLCSCGGKPTTITPPATTPNTQTKPTTSKWVPPKKAGFDDHSYDTLPSVEAFEQLSAKGVGENRELKFLIEDFKKKPSVHFLDGAFYKLHDEWYWFRLLNGQEVHEQNPRPTLKKDLKSIAEVYSWAREQKELPVGMGWVEDGRLYSAHFYEVALGYPRDFGLGTIVYIAPKKDKPAKWAFELEYSDKVSPEELAVFFDQLEKNIPKEIFSELRWLIRSPSQEEVAQEMEKSKLKYFERIMRYDEITVDGEVEVYGAGITAGHLRHVKDVNQLNTFPSDILVLDNIPDFLPPASGLLTAVPQTPLAHIALLARNRGIPNAYRGGMFNDPKFEQMAAGYAAVIIRATPPNQLDVVQITDDEFNTWYQMSYANYSEAPPVDYEKASNTVLLSTLSLQDVDSIRPIFGGKNAGILALQEAKVTMQENPVGISIKPYWEHIKEFVPSINQVMMSADFLENPKARFLALEGPKQFDKRYPNPDDKQLKEKIFGKYDEGTPIGNVYRKGLVNLIEDKPMAPETLADIRKTLEEQFGSYAPEQGLRFRSSSTIEDIEGFNGAGLYESFTGYLQPEKVEEKDKKKSIEWAIKHTWASYWCFEAFQERDNASVNHLSGGMAVLVHANFPDKKEISNGVFTVTLYPEGFQEYASMELNAQKGSLSVTNPEAKDNALPEVERVSLLRGETKASISRKKSSTLAETGSYLLSEAQIQEIFTQGLAVTEAVLKQQNSKLAKEKQNRTLTMDFEFRQVAEGWPALSSGEQKPSRIVIKQARSLEPGLGKLPFLIRSLNAPRDIVARSSRVVRRVLRTNELNVNIIQLYTDPLKNPDLGFTQVPFSAEVEIETIQNVPPLGLKRAVKVRIPHTAWSGASYPDGLSDSQWSFSATLTEEQAKAFGVSSIEILGDGTCRIIGPEGKFEAKAKEVKTDVIYATPEVYLLDLLSAKKKSIP